MSPKDSSISLEDIRDLASTQIKHKLIKADGVANVDIFGGDEKELQIIVDKVSNIYLIGTSKALHFFKKITNIDF